jgi:hypothetical protein
MAYLHEYIMEKRETIRRFVREMKNGCFVLCVE